MPRVTVQPAGVQFEVEDGESVAEAAWRQGYVWPTRCWGQADCMSCFTKIVGGELNAIPADENELDAIRLKLAAPLRNDPTVRLGCQLRCTGDALVVEKRGFRVTSAEDNNMVDPAESHSA
ncbi:2Fe-2S iron-sulfur cluster-binding protein [Rhodococcus koreensis]